MWLSQQRRDLSRREMPAETGSVTLGGDPAGIYLSGERRGVAVYSPGGYQWKPVPGQEVLVLKAGADAETPCVVGVRQNTHLAPGEVCLSNGDDSAQMYLTKDGRLKLGGSVMVNGVDLDIWIRQIVETVLDERKDDEEGGLI